MELATFLVNGTELVTCLVSGMKLVTCLVSGMELVTCLVKWHGACPRSPALLDEYPSARSGWRVRDRALDFNIQSAMTVISGDDHDVFK